MVAKQVPDRDEPGGLPVEFRQYLSQSVIPRSEDPFKYWMNMKKLFPNVYKLAIKYLSIVATSVPSERLFSKTGNIASGKRSRLDPERLSQLAFLSSLPEEKWGLKTSNSVF